MTLFGYTLIKQSYLDAIIMYNKTLFNALKMDDKEIEELKTRLDILMERCESYSKDKGGEYYVVDYGIACSVQQRIGDDFRFIYDHEYNFDNEEEKAYAKLRCEEICELLSQDRE